MFLILRCTPCFLLAEDIDYDNQPAPKAAAPVVKGKWDDEDKEDDDVPESWDVDVSALFVRIHTTHRNLRWCALELYGPASLNGCLAVLQEEEVKKKKEEELKKKQEEEKKRLEEKKKKQAEQKAKKEKEEAAKKEKASRDQFMKDLEARKKKQKEMEEAQRKAGIGLDDGANDRAAARKAQEVCVRTYVLWRMFLFLCPRHVLHPLLGFEGVSLVAQERLRGQDWQALSSLW